jgi:anthranilate/para-aminobenzoate synthase component I
VPNAALPIVEELIPPPEPWLVARQLSNQPHLLFLDSNDRRSSLGRFSYVSASPRSLLRARVDDDPNLWKQLISLLSERSTSRVDLPPFQGGIAGVFGYGVGRSIESLPVPEFDEFSLPDLVLGVYSWVISFDHHQRRAWIVSHDGDESQLDAIRSALGKPVSPAQQGRFETVTIRAGNWALRNQPGVFSNSRARSMRRPSVALSSTFMQAIVFRSIFRNDC